MTFDPVDSAREEVAPLLLMLCEVMDPEDVPDQHAFFRAILDAIERCQRPEDLADPFMQLSTSAFLGFQYSSEATLLLDMILDRAQRLAEVLSLDPDEIH